MNMSGNWSLKKATPKGKKEKRLLQLRKKLETSSISRSIE